MGPASNRTIVIIKRGDVETDTQVERDVNMKTGWGDASTCQRLPVNQQTHGESVEQILPHIRNQTL